MINEDIDKATDEPNLDDGPATVVAPDAATCERGFNLARGETLDRRSGASDGVLFRNWNTRDFGMRISFYAREAATNPRLTNSTIRLPLGAIAPALRERLGEPCIAFNRLAPDVDGDQSDFERAINTRIYRLLRFPSAAEMLDDPLGCETRAELLSELLDGGDHEALPVSFAYTLIGIGDAEGQERDECPSFFRCDDLSFAKFWASPRPERMRGPTARDHMRHHRQIARSWRNLSAFLTATLDEVGRQASMPGYQPPDDVYVPLRTPPCDPADTPSVFVSERASATPTHPKLAHSTVALDFEEWAPALRDSEYLECSPRHLQNFRAEVPEIVTMLQREIDALRSKIRENTSENQQWDELLAERLADLIDDRGDFTKEVPVSTVPDLIRSCERNSRHYETCSKLAMAESDRRSIENNTSGCGMSVVDYMFDHRMMHRRLMQSWLDLAAYLAARLDALGRYADSATATAAVDAERTPDEPTDAPRDGLPEAEPTDATRDATPEPESTAETRDAMREAA